MLNFEDFAGCMSEYLESPYLFAIRTFPPGEGATGGTTRLDVANNVEAVGLDPGPLVPFEHPQWTVAGQAYAGGGGGAFCALVAAANVLLHEMMHVCVDGENDKRNCWAVQNMLATAFTTAMAQRYPCMASSPCCNRTDPRFFMSSQPDIWLDPQMTMPVPGTQVTEPMGADDGRISVFNRVNWSTGRC